MNTCSDCGHVHPFVAPVPGIKVATYCTVVVGTIRTTDEDGFTDSEPDFCGCLKGGVAV